MGSQATTHLEEQMTNAGWQPFIGKRCRRWIPPPCCHGLNMCHRDLRRTLLHSQATCLVQYIDGPVWQTSAADTMPGHLNGLLCQMSWNPQFMMRGIQGQQTPEHLSRRCFTRLRELDHLEAPFKG